MEYKKIVEMCRDSYLDFSSKSSSSLDKNIEEFDNRKELIKNIDIKDNEIIKCVASIYTGNWGITRRGLLVATNTRIFVLFNKGLAGAEVHTFYYKRISSIDYKKSFLSPELTISTNGDKELTFACFSPDTLGKLLRESMEDSLNDEEKRNETKNSSTDIIGQLEKLHKLKETGAISEEEYGELKRQLINN